MTHMGTFLILLSPAVLATGLHARLMPQKRTPLNLLGLAVLYAFAIAWPLCAVKYLRGKEAIPVADSFDTVKNFVVYGPAAMFLGALFPVLVRLGRGVSERIFRRRPAEAAALEPPAPAPAKKAEPTPRADAAPAAQEEEIAAARANKAAHDADLARRTDASLAAQEEEMVAAHAKVVPRRRAAGGPAPMLFNVGTRDTKAAKKTVRQRLAGVFVYALLGLLVFVIVYGVLTSPVGT